MFKAGEYSRRMDIPKFQHLNPTPGVVLVLPYNVLSERDHPLDVMATACLSFYLYYGVHQYHVG